MNTLTKLALIAILAFAFAGSADAGKVQFSFGGKGHASKGSSKGSTWGKSGSSSKWGKQWGQKKSGSSWGKKGFSKYKQHRHNYCYQTERVWIPAVTRHVFVGYVNGCKKYDNVIVKKGYFKNVRYKVCGCGHRIG